MTRASNNLTNSVDINWVHGPMTMNSPTANGRKDPENNPRIDLAFLMGYVLGANMNQKQKIPYQILCIGSKELTEIR